MVIPDEERVAEYYEFRQQLEQMSADFRDVITHPNYSLPFLQSGRLVKVKHKELDFGWGVILNYQKRLPAKVCLFIHFSLPCGLTDFVPELRNRIDQCPKQKNSHHTNNTSSTSSSTASKAPSSPKTAIT